MKLSRSLQQHGINRASAQAAFMIEIVENPSQALETQIVQYIQHLPRSSGVCGEHDPRWLSILRDALRHRPIMLVARRDDQSIAGYLPLVLIASRLFGRFLISLPYINRAGVLAENDSVATELIDAAVELSNRKNVRYLELRHQERAFTHPAFNAQRDEKMEMILDLPASSDELWQSIGPKVRNQIRKAEQHNLSIQWGGRELLNDFYRIFAINMRDLGTPVYGRKLFDQILTRFPSEAELAIVSHENKPVAGALLMHEPAVADRPALTQVPSASTLRSANHTNANMWMYHQLLLRAIARGSNRFDFGRSSEGSGTYRFKKQWGAQPHPTIWQYHVRIGDINEMRPDNPKNRRRIALWQRLPVWLANFLGPRIVRGIP